MIPDYGPGWLAFSSICLMVCSLILMVSVIRLGRMERKLRNMVADMLILTPDCSFQPSQDHSFFAHHRRTLAESDRSSLLAATGSISMETTKESGLSGSTES